MNSLKQHPARTGITIGWGLFVLGFALMLRGPSDSALCLMALGVGVGGTVVIWTVTGIN